MKKRFMTHFTGTLTNLSYRGRFSPLSHWLARIILSACLLTLFHSARGQMVLPGWDLFTTVNGTTFFGAPFLGVPLGTYNFGGSIGVQNVGNTDTIVQRISAINSPSGTTDLQLDALQMSTPTPVSIGPGPVGIYFITLQSARGGTASMGSMTADLGSGTFNTSFDVFFDLRYGALNGPIVYTSDIVLAGNDSWTSSAPAHALTIPGVNYLLDGTDIGDDFWPSDPLEISNGPGSQQVVMNTEIPEPAAGTLVLIGAALLALRKKCSR